MAIWLGEDGRAVPPPAGSGRAILAGATSAGTVLIVGGTVLFLLRWAVHRAISTRNLRRWEREWTRVESEWTNGR